MRLWAVDGEDLHGLSKSSLLNENQLENWLEKDIAILDDTLLVIGRQIPTHMVVESI